jgi:metal-sulfur cluster biosynthetic enzyme
VKLPVLQATSSARIRRALEDTLAGGVAAATGLPRAAEGAAPESASGVAAAGEAPCATYPDTPLWNALREVRDPELPVSVVDLGLIVDVRQRGGQVELDLTYTATGCPCMGFIQGDVRQRLLAEPGVEHVVVNDVWQPAWTRARITATGRAALRACGVAA